METISNDKINRNRFEAKEEYKKIESSAHELVDILKPRKKDYESENRQKIIEEKLTTAKKFIFQHLVKEYGIEFTGKVLMNTRTILIGLNDSNIIDNLYFQVLNKFISEWMSEVLKLKGSLK